MMIREKSFVRFILAICIVVVMTIPARSQQRSNLVSQKLGSHTYIIPRDLIEMIFKPDYSREANPNPNWSHEPVIRLSLQWPDFEAPKGDDRLELAKRTIKITLLEFSAARTKSIDQIVERMDALGLKPQITSAQYGLKEIRSDRTKYFRDYIAAPDQGAEYLIRCDESDDGAKERLFYSCEYTFGYADISVNVYFTSLLFKDWRAIHKKTVALLDGMRKD